MDIYFYNTLTKQKDLFKPIEEGKVKIYSCGPTVYKDATIGNMRTNLFQDTLRRVLEYPPYCDICMLGFVGRDDNSALSASKAMFEIIKNLVCGEFSDVKVKILGPSPAKIIKVGGKFRYRIIIKCKNSKRFREMLKTALCETGKLNFRSVSVYADMNPEGIL